MCLHIYAWSLYFLAGEKLKAIGNNCSYIEPWTSRNTLVKSDCGVLKQACTSEAYYNPHPLTPTFSDISPQGQFGSVTAPVAIFFL